MADQPSLQVSAGVSQEEYRQVCRGLIGYNVDRTSGEVQKPGVDINVVLRDEQGRVWGGCFCETWLYSLYVDVLWIDESIRGQGHGRALMEEAERIGREQGCTFAHTTTFSYQAPQFYQAVGYTIFAAMDDYPDGIVQYFLKKRLNP